MVARVTFAGLLASTLSGAGGLAPQFAHAAGTTLFDQPFKTSSADPTYPVYLPALPSAAANPVCLSARGNTTGTGLHTCPTNTDAPGLGVLRLTNTSTFQEGGVFGAVSVPTSQGLDVTFNMYQYGGSGADGVAFVVAAVDPANPVPPATIGQPGGALGYSSSKQGNLAGLENAYLGVGFDVFGNFSNNVYEGSGCTDPPYISTVGGRVPGQVVVRGPGDNTTGYCAINSTAATTASPPLALRSNNNRGASLVPVEVAINPTASAFVTSSGLTVPAGTYKVAFTPVNGTQRTLQGTLPTVSPALYPSATWLNANGIPRQLAFGWVGSTGGSTDFHEIDFAKVVSFNPVPALTIAQTSYNGSSPQPGGPVTYTVKAGVSATGNNETSPISVTETMPAGVVPVGAFGAGWVCGVPSGQKITCTNSNGPFAAGSTLPEITMVGIVTGGSVTPALIQSSSVVTASSNDANPAIATTTTAGTIPAAPSGITLSPASGTISGGGTVTVSGANLIGANAIEIGTTAEQQAGTPVVLLPCAAGPAAGCFTDNGNGTLTIHSMPPRATAATVTVTVVTDGVAGAANYVYTSAPGTPSAPTATAGVTSATVVWTAPAANGSPITGYVVTPYRNGVAQAPQSFDASTTTRTLTGLTVGASYTFTVTAINAIGTGAASVQSNAVVPYTVPGQPTITAVTAGDLSATLTFTAPSNGSSPITGYIVTPYIGDVAQTPQSFSGTATTRTATGLTAGTAYTFTVTAVNAAGPGPASLRSTAVTPNANPLLTFPPPPSGQVGIAYSVPLTMTGGTAPIAWSVSAGSLPPGVTLNPSTGLLSGTPTAAGSYSFTVRIVDAAGQSDTRAATVVIVASPTLTFPPPPAGQVGVPYSDQLTVSGGTAPYAWSVSAGSLPPGVTLNPSTGLLSGTPTVVGSYPFTVRVTDARGQSDTRSATIVVTAGPLIITKTADTADASPGTVVRYTITVANTSASPFTGVTFTDPLTDVLDDATYNADVAATSGTAGFTSPNVTWTGDLAAGATATITYSVTVRPAGSGNGTMSNTVTSPTLGNNCTTGSPDPRCQTTVRLLALTIVKTAGAATTTPGATVNYTVTVTNTGRAAYAAATFSDSLAGVLDDAVYNGDAAASSGAVAFTSPTLTWTGALAAGGSATVTYSVTVKSPDTGDKALTNAVTSSSSGSNCPAGGTDPRCRTSVTALIPQLTIVTATDISTAVPTDVVRYTVTATNTGQTAYVNGEANFTFSLAGAEGTTYNGDGTATSGNLTFNLDGTVTWVGDLAIGQSVTATASVTVNNPYTGAGTVTSLVTSTTPGNTCPAGGSDPGCVTTVTVLVPQLTITKSTNVATATPGDTVTFTVTVANTGPTAYTGASFTDSLTTVLTDAVYNNDATASTGTVGYTAPNLTWTGDLAIGATATITYTVTVRDPDPGDKRPYNGVTSTTLGNNCPPGGTDQACIARFTVLIPALTITVTPGAPTVAVGGTVTYTMTVANTGPTPYTGITVADSLAGVLDDAVYNGDATASSGTVGYTAPTLTWTGNLAVGATATITYTVTTNNPISGNGLLVNAATSTAAGNNCPAGGTDTRCTSTVPISQLILSQSYAEPTTTPGSIVHLTATFTNTGQTPYTGITVFAPTAGTVDDAIPNGDQSATSGTLSLSPTGISWTGDIPAGGVVTVTGSLTVRNPDPGDKVITGTLVSSAPGNNCPAGGTDPRCTARTDVLIPALSISKVANTAVQVPGGTVGYTVTVQNTGQTAYTGATVTDSLSGLLDDAVYNNDAAATTGTVGYAAPTLTWTGDLAVGATAVITYTATVLSPDPGDKLMVDKVSSTAAGSLCPPDSGSATCSANVAVLTPALTVVKTADQPYTTAGSTVTYTITVTNSGQTPYTGAVVTDDLTGVLDDAAYGNDAAASSGTVGYTAPTLTWTGNLAVGAAATITYTIVVNNPDLGDASLSNAVTTTAAGGNCPAVGGTDSRCAVTVPITSTNVLTFVKTPSAASATRSGVVGYTITISNSAASPYVGATFTDPLTDVLDDATYNADAAASSGTVGYTAPTLTWTGDVPAGGSVTVTYSVTVHATKTGDDILANTLVSTSPTGNCLSGSGDPRCAATVTVAELTIVNTSDVPTTTPGALIRLTSTFTNTGQTPYNGISVYFDGTDLSDDVTGNGDQSATSGTMSVGTAGLTWTGDVPVGGVVVLSASFTVNDPPTGDRDIVLLTSSSAPGNNCFTGSGDPRCTTDVRILIPGLTITKTGSAAFTVPGGTVGYTITLHNTGETAYTGISVTDQLSGVLDDAVYNDDGSASGGTVSFAGTVLTWSGNIAVGATVTVTYSVTVRNPDPGDKVLVNPVSSEAAGSTCTSTTRPAACTATVGVLTPALTIVKTTGAATTTPGATVNYTVTVTNTGQTAYAAATFSDSLAGVLDDAVYNGDAAASSGTVSFSSPSLTWTGALAVGAAATVTYSVTVNSPDTGNKVLTNAVTSSSSGSNCLTGGTDSRCLATVPVGVLTIVTATDISTAVPTDVVRYTVTVTNTGQTAYVNGEANFTFSLAGAEGTTYNGDGTATSGNLTFNLDGTVTWVGDLAIGQSVTATASVTVNNPYTGAGTVTSLVTSTTPGNTCPAGGSDPGCVTTVTVLVPQLTITKSTNVATATPGDTVTFTVTVANTGPTAYTGASFTDSLTTVLTDAVYNNDATASTGTVGYTAPNLTWTGDLAIGATATITYTVTVRDPDPGDKRPYNGVTSTTLGNNCPPGGTDQACIARFTVLIPALTITVTAGAATVVAAGTVTYTVTVVNTGQTPYTGVTVADSLAGVVDDAVYNNDATATSGAVSYTAPTLTWTGNLAVGATATITYTVTANNPISGDGVLTTTVTSAAVGGNCPVGGTDGRCGDTVTVIAQSITLSDLGEGFTLTGLPDTTVRGDGVVTMTVVTNSPGGYSVTAQAASAVLTSPRTDATIPISALKVRETGTSSFQPLSATVPVPVHQQSGPSAQNGDVLRNDYEVDIPFVPSGQYSATIDYVATTE
ncbi:DUF7507 domain-containing protein [Sphaerisporangium dianthi]|uniref:Ig domain-containing protein n=1 Tax=Sphaerisporangium dianthi TaxID=1436120 RepID=A0ABV9CFR7_9ACTN